ncbi:MAG: T9SS C-terminal target domain-containing protein [Chlorobiota bacterium]|nr:MAG: T9SS C-terminal target domain-containing protein [Chlorobiota bacterium]
MKHTVTASLIAVAIAGLTTVEMHAAYHNTQHGRTKAFLAASYLQTARLARPLNDTVRKVSRIVGISFDSQSDLLTVRLDLADTQSWMEISLYNMLGKRVKEIYRGPAQADDSYRDFTTTLSELPNGLYIVSVQGSSIRLADKVFISR